MRNRTRHFQWALCAIVASTMSASAWAEQSSQPVIANDVLLPIPASVEQTAGHYVPQATIKIVVPKNSDKELKSIGAEAANMLGSAWNRKANVTTGAPAKNAIKLALMPDSKANPESYQLSVKTDGITLSAPTAQGLFYGLQTLRQLAEKSGSAGIASVTIKDVPRFRWRGMHLDSARHMQPISYIKSQLDLMARYKYNRFHWHLTDDQGWRMEIKRYPKPTSIGAWREETVAGRQLNPYVGDGKPYGGFYTQEQIREVVAYAKARNIEVIPEIDIPGHTVAVLAAYPELACKPGPYKVYTTWGVSDDILCPSDASIELVKNVLADVFEMFPSKYIHLGGDEAPTIRWEESELAQSIIRREGLKDEHALQGWFLKQIEQYVHARGRKVIGWDEVLDGSPSPTTTVMSWRGMKGGIAAARQGHDVIMSPTDTAYFDYCQSEPINEPICIGNHIPLKTVYDFEPVPAELTPTEAQYILGGQANLWTEYLKTPQAVQYMLWPRGLAMSEVLWSSKNSRDWKGFNTRMNTQLPVLTKLGVNYRIAAVEGLDNQFVTLEPSVTLTLRAPEPGSTIRYTIDGSEPGPNSTLYSGPFTIPLTSNDTKVIARPFVQGRAGPLSRGSYRVEKLRAPVPAPSRNLKQGLSYKFYEVAVNAASKLDPLKPKRTETATQVGLPEYANMQTFGLIFDGYIRVPEDGVYTFSLASDDGSILSIGGKNVVDRDGPRSTGDTNGSIALAKGLHKVKLRYFQGGGAANLALKVSRNGDPLQPVPQDWWVRD